MDRSKRVHQTERGLKDRIDMWTVREERNMKRALTPRVKRGPAHDAQCQWSPKPFGSTQPPQAQDGCG